MDSNHRRRKPAELQSAPFGHSGNCPYLFFAVQRYKLFLNCANGTAHLQCGLRCFGSLVAQATACSLLSLLHRFGRQDAEDDGCRSRAEASDSHVQLGYTEGHALTDVVEVGGVPTDDTADSDDGIHTVVQQAGRSIDELEGPGTRKTVIFFTSCLRSTSRAPSSRGSVMLLFHSATAMPMCSPSPEGTGL